MRLAVLADIHANLPALEAVLADLEGVGPDLAIVNGDHVNRGPSNAAVIERLWDYANGRKVLFTLGNHDDLLLKWANHDLEIDHLRSDPLFLPAAWATEQLGEVHLDWIAGLPTQIHLEEFGLRATHGSPRHYREGLDEWLTDAALGEIIEQYPARVLLGSHTHRPYHMLRHGVWVLNSGAVGSPFNRDTRAQYLVLELEGGEVRTEFRAVPYDLERALDDFKTSGLLEAGGLGAELFYLELRTARSFLTPFFLWAVEHNLPRDAEAWARFRLENPERFVGVT
ncbi:MAG: metallophosphoesterase family protein [Meiothermus sp.]|nr:metallophosphoesterase family protein [Meiothermus sp.]